jgi:hypothetical protein
MPDCLQRLLAALRDYNPTRRPDKGNKDNVAAVAGLVHHPGNVRPLPPFLDGTLNDVFAGLNMQWYDWNTGDKEVEHLYSTFLYRVKAGRQVGGYPTELSTVGHREETIFTYKLKRAGWVLLITPYAKTWHLREAKGGIRSFNDPSLWEHDEEVFQGYLQRWEVTPKPSKIIVLDCGLGDHFAFKSILPKLKEIHADKELILAVCYPDVLKDEGLKLLSIAEAKTMLGEGYDESSIYKKLWDINWKGSLAEGMLAVCQ